MDDKLRHLEERISALASQIDLQGTHIKQLHKVLTDQGTIRAPGLLYVNATEIAVRAGEDVFVFPIEQLRYAFDNLDPDYERGARAALQRLAQPGMIYVDIGAGAGVLAAHAAKKVGASGLVITADPLVNLVPAITRNVFFNASATPHHHHINAVLDAVGALPFWYHALDNRFSTFYRDMENGPKGNWVHASVEGLRLISILPADDTRDLLVRIDTNGTEMHILRDILASRNTFYARQMQLLVSYDPASLKRGGASARDFLLVANALCQRTIYLDPVSGHDTHYFSESTLDEAGMLLLTLPSL